VFQRSGYTHNKEKSQRKALRTVYDGVAPLPRLEKNAADVDPQVAFSPGQNLQREEREGMRPRRAWALHLHDAPVPRSVQDAAQQIGARRGAIVVDQPLLQRLRRLLNRRTGRHFFDSSCKARRRQAFDWKGGGGSSDGVQAIGPEPRVEYEGNADGGDAGPQRAATLGA
jgi:hypothetical protein